MKNFVRESLEDNQNIPIYRDVDLKETLEKFVDALEKITDEDRKDIMSEMSDIHCAAGVNSIEGWWSLRYYAGVEDLPYQVEFKDKSGWTDGGQFETLEEAIEYLEEEYEREEMDQQAGAYNEFCDECGEEIPEDENEGDGLCASCREQLEDEDY